MHLQTAHRMKPRNDRIASSVKLNEMNIILKMDARCSISSARRREISSSLAVRSSLTSPGEQSRYLWMGIGHSFVNFVRFFFSLFLLRFWSDCCQNEKWAESCSIHSPKHRPERRTRNQHEIFVWPVYSRISTKQTLAEENNDVQSHHKYKNRLAAESTRMLRVLWSRVLRYSPYTGIDHYQLNGIVCSVALPCERDYLKIHA